MQKQKQTIIFVCGSAGYIPDFQHWHALMLFWPVLTLRLMTHYCESVMESPVAYMCLFFKCWILLLLLTFFLSLYFSLIICPFLSLLSSFFFTKTPLNKNRISKVTTKLLYSIFRLTFILILIQIHYLRREVWQINSIYLEIQNSGKHLRFCIIKKELDNWLFMRKFHSKT